MLCFHAKTQPEGLPSGAGRPPLGRPAWGSRHVATDFWTVALIFSWRWLVVALDPRVHVLGRSALGRPAGLPLAPLGPLLHRHYTCMLVIFQGGGLLTWTCLCTEWWVL